jgi:hypothetical protein
LTLGTGVGSAVFVDGWLAPHLGVAQHPLYNGDTYNEYVGNEALHRQGKKKWNRRVLKVIGAVNSLLHYDVLYLRGGNAQHLTVDLPQNVRIASNANGITGGIHLWDEAVWRNVRGSHRRGAPEHRQTEAAVSKLRSRRNLAARQRNCHVVGDPQSPWWGEALARPVEAVHPGRVRDEHRRRAIELEPAFHHASGCSPPIALDRRSCRSRRCGAAVGYEGLA